MVEFSAIDGNSLAIYCLCICHRYELFLQTKTFFKSYHLHYDYCELLHGDRGKYCNVTISQRISFRTLDISTILFCKYASWIVLAVSYCLCHHNI